MDYDNVLELIDGVSTFGQEDELVELMEDYGDLVK